MLDEFLHRTFQPLEETLVSRGFGFSEVLTIFLILTVCLTVPWIRIFKRAGYSPGLGLLMFIPLLNIFMFLLFAYHEWPIERDLRTPDESAMWR